MHVLEKWKVIEYSGMSKHCLPLQKNPFVVGKWITISNVGCIE